MHYYAGQGYPTYPVVRTNKDITKLQTDSRWIIGVE